MLSSRLIDSRDQVEALQEKKEVLRVITRRAMKKINIYVKLARCSAFLTLKGRESAKSIDPSIDPFFTQQNAS